MGKPLTPEAVAEKRVYDRFLPRGTGRFGGSTVKIRAIPKPVKRPTNVARIFRHGWVYFLRCETYVKIGWTTDLPSRLTKLKTGNPLPIEFLFCIEADQSKETMLHDRFRAYHHRDEWFRLEGDLQAFVEADDEAG